MAHAIINGRFAPESEARSTVYIAYAQNSASCTGVVISPHVILTAGHCVVGQKPSSLLFSSRASVTAASTRIDIAKIALNPDYTGAVQGQQASHVSANDIGVIVTNDDLLRVFDLTQDDLPQLATTTSELMKHLNNQISSLRIYGYGHATAQLESFETTSDRRVLNVSASGAFSPESHELTRITALTLEPQKTVCFGDSGSGLFDMASGKRVLLGITNSMLAGGKLFKEFDDRNKRIEAKLSPLLAECKITESEIKAKMRLSEADMARVCGDNETNMNVAPLSAHICWIASVTGLRIDPKIKCPSSSPAPAALAFASQSSSSSPVTISNSKQDDDSNVCVPKSKK